MKHHPDLIAAIMRHTRVSPDGALYLPSEIYSPRRETPREFLTDCGVSRVSESALDGVWLARGVYDGDKVSLTLTGCFKIEGRAL